MKKSLFATSISLRRVLSMLQPSGVISMVLQDNGKLVTLIAGSSKWWSFLMVGDGR